MVEDVGCYSAPEEDLWEGGRHLDPLYRAEERRRGLLMYSPPDKLDYRHGNSGVPEGMVMRPGLYSSPFTPKGWDLRSRRRLFAAFAQ